MMAFFYVDIFMILCKLIHSVFTGVLCFCNACNDWGAMGRWELDRRRECMNAGDGIA